MSEHKRFYVCAVAVFCCTLLNLSLPNGGRAHNGASNIVVVRHVEDTVHLFVESSSPTAVKNCKTLQENGVLGQAHYVCQRSNVTNSGITISGLSQLMLVVRSGDEIKTHPIRARNGSLHIPSTLLKPGLHKRHQGNAEWLMDGVLHVLSGYDHLLFLLGLALLIIALHSEARTKHTFSARSLVLRPLATLVTLFAFGHFVALVIIGNGFFLMEKHVVEALIGMSLAAIGYELVVHRRHANEMLKNSFLLGDEGAGVQHRLEVVGRGGVSQLLAALSVLLAGLVHGSAVASDAPLALSSFEPTTYLVPFSLGLEIAQLGTCVVLAIMYAGVARLGVVEVVTRAVGWIVGLIGCVLIGTRFDGI